jgi:hypothetical protein
MNQATLLQTPVGITQNKRFLSCNTVRLGVRHITKQQLVIDLPKRAYRPKDTPVSLALCGCRQETTQTIIHKVI